MEKAAMEIRLLGRFDIVVDDVAVPLGGPRQRAVLAVLSVHANQIVSFDRLVDALWGERLPATAVPTMQRYISHLRRALHGLPAAIETRRPGYVLCVDSESIDARRFERMVDEGRTHLASGAVEEAAAVLRTALSLWRGDPLADFGDEPFARIETTRLEELRTTAVELRIDAELAAGRHRDLVPELEALVAAHPLRESYRGQLMRALHRSGRRADALRVYSEGRHMLADELGLDPSTGLQRLEQAILLRDPDVDAPTPAPQAMSIGRLPGEVTSFVGRSSEVQDVTALLTRSRLVTLTGAGGSGKSRLALRVATTLAPTFPGGAWWVELGAVTDAAIVPRVVAHVLGVREEPDRDIADGLVEALQHQQCLVVLDGCEHLLDSVAPLADRLLSHTTGVRILATSRELLDVRGEATFLVPTLSVPETGEDATLDAVAAHDSVRLFIERAQAVDSAFRADDDNAATIAEVCRRLDGLPLALELAAARTDVLTLGQLAERLDHRFELLTGGHRTAPPRHRTLRATIEWSYDLLGEDERLLFDRLSVFAGSFTIDTAEAVCVGEGIDTADVFPLLSRLVRQSLVVRVHSRSPVARYRLLDTLRDYGRDRLRLRPDATSAYRRHASVFVDMAEREGPLVRGPGTVRVVEALEAERAEFRAALSWLLDTGDAEQACRLAVALTPFWDYRFQVQDALMWLERSAEAADRSGQPPSSARLWAMVQAAYFAYKHDDFPRAIAWCDEAFRLLEVLPDDVAEATALTARGEVARYQNDLELAADMCTRALEVSRRCGDLWNEGDAHRVLTLIACNRGDLDAAAGHADECLRLYRTIGSMEKTAGAQSLVAAIARDRGRFAMAAELFEECLGRFQQVGEPFGIGNMLWHLSITSAMQGDYEAAARFAEESLRVFEDIDMARGIGQGYQLLADAALGRGRLDEADAFCRSALARFRPRGFTGDLVLALDTATRIRLARGDLDDALRCCDEGLLHARERGYLRDTARLLCLRAEVRLRQGETAEARALAAEASTMFEEAADARGAAVALVTLAGIELADGRPGDARVHLRAAAARLAAAESAFTFAEAREFERIATAVDAAVGIPHTG